MSARAQTIPKHHASATRRIAFVVPSVASARQLHAPLFEAITGLGHMVLCLVPAADPDSAEDLNAETGTYDAKPEGWSFLQNKRAVQGLADVLKDWRAHMVVSAGPDIARLTGLACERAGIAQHIALVTEHIDGAQAGTAQTWREALSASSSAIFFNHDDRQSALKSGLLAKTLLASVVPGPGLDLVAQSPLALPDTANGMVFMMHTAPGQPGNTKIMLEAAAAITAANPTASILVSGLAPGKQDALPSRVTRIADEITDLRPALAQCHVFIHIANRDGIAMPVLAALAAGRPVITTDTPGCRDTVDDLVNGCLVEPGSAGPLVRAMNIFIAQPSLLNAAARASRLKAERWFDQRDINRRWLEALTLKV